MRYPGSKSRYAEAIAQRLAIPRDRLAHYIEPFMGGAGVALYLMQHELRLGSRVSLGDLDPGVVALWTAVRDSPEELCDAIASVVPGRAAYDDAKLHDGDASKGFVACAVRKLVLHQMSARGFGAMSGGPMTDIDSRWRPLNLRDDVRAIHFAMRGFEVEVEVRDAISLLQRTDPNAYAYIDPPYLGMGPVLYLHCDVELHGRLSRTLQKRRRWLLSYDDAPEIRAIYEWAKIGELPVKYAGSRKSVAELLIEPPDAASVLDHSARTRLGMARARASGVRLGRPSNSLSGRTYPSGRDA